MVEGSNSQFRAIQSTNSGKAIDGPGTKYKWGDVFGTALSLSTGNVFAYEPYRHQKELLGVKQHTMVNGCFCAKETSVC